jgi:hypothetical protein
MKNLLKVQKEKTFEKNLATSNILDCVKFWNREGHDIHKRNLEGTLGTKETNEMAAKMVAEDFILEMLLGDCKTFSKALTRLKGVRSKSGRTRSHVWFHQDDERMLMIHF